MFSFGKTVGRKRLRWYYKRCRLKLKYRFKLWLRSLKLIKLSYFRFILLWRFFKVKVAALIRASYIEYCNAAKLYYMYEVKSFGYVICISIYWKNLWLLGIVDLLHKQKIPRKNEPIRAVVQMNRSPQPYTRTQSLFKIYRAPLLLQLVTSFSHLRENVISHY